MTYPSKEEINQEAERVLVFDHKPDIRFVPINSAWQHKNNVLYKVILIANEFSTNEKYPVTIIYQTIAVEKEGRKIWSRPLTDWYRSMTFVRILPEIPS